jgi:hypothetical protein
MAGNTVPAGIKGGKAVHIFVTIIGAILIVVGIVIKVNLTADEREENAAALFLMYNSAMADDMCEIDLRKWRYLQDNATSSMVITLRQLLIAALLLVSGAAHARPQERIPPPKAANKQNELLSLVGNLSDITRDQTESISRLKLAFEETPIRLRVPGIKPIITHDHKLSQRYSSYVPVKTLFAYGEEVTIKLDQNGETLAEASWSTHFPASLPPNVGVVPAEISGEDLLTKLLHLPVFGSDDVAALAHSHIPEVRIAAAANLTDQTLLLQLARTDNVAAVRDAAMDRSDQQALQSNDQPLLAEIAVNNSDWPVRMAAIKKLPFRRS